MNNVIKLFEETWGADAQPRRQHFSSLRLVHSQLSVVEIISEWVKTEFEAFGARNAPNQPIAETRAKIFEIIDIGSSVPKTLQAAQNGAVDAFRNGHVLFFWNDRQITDPDELLSVLGENEAVFVRIFPMIGG